MFSYLLTAFNLLKNIPWKTVFNYGGYGVCIILIIIFAYKYYDTSVDFANYQLEVQQTQANIDKENLAVQLKNTELINDLETKLNQARIERIAQEAKIKELIDEAVKTDGVTYTGLGPNSVRLYNQALGIN